MKKETPSYEGTIALNIASIAETAVKESLTQAAKTFEEFKAQVEKSMNEMVTTRPVLHVAVSDGADIKEVKGRTSPILARLVTNAKLGLYSLLIGPAGCGKTTAASQVADALGLQFGSVCLTAGASETWLFGRQTPSGFVEGIFAKIYREGGVFLADEMDAADANLLLSINTALSHGVITNPMNGQVITKHEDFVFIGAANTNGKGSNHLYTGRSRLDAATLDRFVLINVDYDKELELELCPDKDLYTFLQDVRSNLKSEGYDEFLSTRAFASSYRQKKAGIPIKEIKDSLIFNWGDAAKQIAETQYSRRFKSNKKEAEEALYFRVVQSKLMQGIPLEAQWQRPF